MSVNPNIASKTRHLAEDFSPPPDGGCLKRCPDYDPFYSDYFNFFFNFFLQWFAARILPKEKAGQNTIAKSFTEQPVNKPETWNKQTDTTWNATQTIKSEFVNAE